MYQEKSIKYVYNYLFHFAPTMLEFEIEKGMILIILISDETNKHTKTTTENPTPKP